MTASTKYGFYLANGPYVEYDLSPDSCLMDIIDDLALAYFDAGGRLFPFSVWMQPQYASMLNKELSLRTVNIAGYISNPVFPQFVRIETVSGPVVILVKHDLPLPIFIGSEKELEDNNLNVEMDKILT